MSRFLLLAVVRHRAIVWDHAIDSSPYGVAWGPISGRVEGHAVKEHV